MPTIPKNKWLFRFMVTPVLLFLLGVGSNRLVMSLNHGMMPVEVPEYSVPPGMRIDEGHYVSDDDTRLKVLDDQYYMDNHIYSLGDFVLDMGYALSLPVLGITAIIERRRKV